MENENKIPETSTEDNIGQKTEIMEGSKASCCSKACGDWCTPERKKMALLAVAIIVVLIAVAGYKFKGINPMAFFQHKKVLTAEEAKAKAADFIDKNLVQPGTKVDISGVTLTGELYKLDINVSGQKIEAYMTKDGSQFFPTAMDMNADPAAAKTDQPAAAPDKEITKSDKPVVDLYVMAFCPYGNKAEDTLKPVYDLLKNKVTFNFHYIVSVNGTDVQSLHGAKEVTEDEKEACVLKTYGNDKWMAIATYVNDKCGSDGACFETGAKTLGIDVTKITACVTASGLDLMKANEKASADAGASGSPTMLVNGVTTSKVYQYGDSETYKQTICSAFNTAPAECSKTLASNTADASQGGSCGN
ncbi:MAG: hypothetical protein WC022_02455 [Parcubacteria group bacterium]